MWLKPSNQTLSNMRFELSISRWQGLFLEGNILFQKHLIPARWTTGMHLVKNYQMKLLGISNNICNKQKISKQQLKEEKNKVKYIQFSLAAVQCCGRAVRIHLVVLSQRKWTVKNCHCINTSIINTKVEHLFKSFKSHTYSNTNKATYQRIS